ncbi:hypothetical protein EIP91_011344 [Steccherinum ochraceum]|uniref:Uncharacterized protein n=1 Tax=Steccherinum ochraceum TaxID=92696 RepID=A0A4R0QZR6_9APHY|nr:hypothetical protein EIP91_011344 [Steccherinum ochraceum]
MPKSRPILDSDPIDIPAHTPPDLRRQKPSAVPLRPATFALPTPPRTKHSRKRKRSLSSSRSVTRRGRVTDSDSEPDDDGHHDHSDHAREGSSTGEAVQVGHKRRKTLRLDALAAEISGQTAEAAEEAFWTGTSSLPAASGPSAEASEASTSKAKAPQAPASPQTRGRSLSRSPTRSPSSSPPARLLRRNNTGLFSPPPSRRHGAPVAALPVTPPPLPRTPKGDRSLKRKLFPERDSLNNPFLVPDESPEALSSPDADAGTPTPLPYVEKPTITYVFRGVKAEFRNPLYDPSHPDGVPSPRADDPSELPIEDPEFSPTPYCPPKLLFPDARKHDHARRTKRKVPAPGSASGSGAELSDAPAKKRIAPGPSTPTPKRASIPRDVKGKSKSKSRSRSNSGWDSSDDEDELPAEPVVTAVEEKEVEAQIKHMPTKELQRLTRKAPLLMDAGER